jgi:DNA processing protein
MTAIDRPEREARIVLSRLVEPGDPDACRLVADFSGVELLDRITTGGGRGGERVRGWHARLPDADFARLMDVAAAVAARFVCPGDTEWPLALADLVRAGDAGSTDRRGGVPFGLWVRGAGSLGTLTDSSVAIVGSRASSAYGDRVAGQLAFECASRGMTTVSGGAYGIDAAAHRGALARERPTVAVLAGGIDKLYPAGNAVMLRRIAEDGVLVAEAAPGAEARKSRFLVRNRLIAAMTRGTVVVEAARRSGSLNTARWALDIGRPVMGVPGPVTSTMSAGVHELLRQPGSLLVTDADQVIEHVSEIGFGLTASPVPP